MDIKKGDKFRSKWFTSKHILVLSVDEVNNSLTVEIVPEEDYRFPWQEDWNLAHTITGFNNRDYKLIKE